MAISRERVEATFAKLHGAANAGNYGAFADLFAKDSTFVNSMMNEAVRGPDALRRLASDWPKVKNDVEWTVIDGNRLVWGWNERQESMRPDAPSLRGISTFVFDDNGLVTSYEGMFDTAAFLAAQRA